MEHNAKCAIIGRKKVDEDLFNCIISLFSVNDAHLKKEVPNESLEFENIDHVNLNSIKAKFFLMGNDIVINNIKTIKITQKDNTLDVEVKQN